jgi:hypothetical protein
MAGTLNNMFTPQPQQPTGKQVRLPSGEMAVFPADMPDDAIANNITQFQAQQQRVQEFGNQHPLAQGLMQFVGPQFGFQPPSKDEFQIPIVPGNTFGMTPETLQSTRNVIANTQQLNASERIRQRVQMEREMEQEKDRAQALKLEQQRLKNQQMMEKMRLQREEEQLRMQGQSRLEQEKIKAESTAQRDQTRFEQQKQLKEMELGRPMVVGNKSVIFDPQSNQFFNATNGELDPALTSISTEQGVFVYDKNNPTQPATKIGGIEGSPVRGGANTGEMSQYQAIMLAEKAARRELDAMAKEDSSLTYLGEDNQMHPTQKGLPHYLRFMEKYKAQYLGQTPAPGGGGTVGPTSVNIDRQTGIRIID